MVADALKLAVSQSLVKKVCPRCSAEERVPGKARLCALGIDPEWLEGLTALRRGRRCEFCRHTGVSGRKPFVPRPRPWSLYRSRWCDPDQCWPIRWRASAPSAP
jgi:hypothetical protein